MSLDVTAYERLTILPTLRDSDCPTLDDDDCGDEFFEHHHPFAYSDFPKSLKGFPEEEWEEEDYHGNRLTRMKHCYQSSGETLRWQGGSYSGYNAFRESLAKHLKIGLSHVWSNAEQYFNFPFFEILNFADNEGWIGPEACARLADAFESEETAYLSATEFVFFKDTYQNFQRGFRLAAHTGGVWFH